MLKMKILTSILVQILKQVVFFINVNDNDNDDDDNIIYIYIYIIYMITHYINLSTQLGFVCRQLRSFYEPTKDRRLFRASCTVTSLEHVAPFLYTNLIFFILIIFIYIYIYIYIYMYICIYIKKEESIKSIFLFIYVYLCYIFFLRSIFIFINTY